MSALPFHDLVPVGGGDVNRAFRGTDDAGRPVFVKAHPDPPPSAVAAEAAGLQWLAEATAAGGPPVPEVLGLADEWLALEWLEPSSPAPDADERLGRALAALHGAGAADFGSPAPGTPGDDEHRADPAGAAPLRLAHLVLPAHPASTWAEHHGARLRDLARAAEREGALPADGRAVVERVAGRLAELVPEPAAPARLHGDLWAGNVVHGPGATPWLVDPAAYGGHPEVDLAMLRLFGGPGEACFAAYAEASPLADGHQARVPLFQLLPLLVHAALFGGSYGARAVDTARRFT